MPQTKKEAERDAVAKLHAKIAGSAKGFRLQPLNSHSPHRDLHYEKENRRLAWLESKGLVMFVSGMGWVDSTSAIRRYSESLGLKFPGE